MSFLAPLFLLASAAVAVPLALHLFHRHDTRRVVFPAVRYLLRTEREHARSIRLRQLLLLVLRVATVLVVVLVGARLFLPGRGHAHHPTALAIVLDNSLSSARVVGDERLFDVLKARALESLDAAGPEDRIWVIRAGEPWDVAVPGGVPDARRRVDATEPTAARGDLDAALRRARTLVGSAGLDAAEIHLLSDAQRTAFSDARGSEPGTDGRPVEPSPRSEASPAGDIPVVVYAPPPEATRNHFVRAVEVGGGLPPLAGQRTEVTVALGADPAGSDTAPGSSLPVRVVVDERIRAAGTGRPDETVTLALGPFADGTVQGWAETDPDDLGADDRRWFVFDVRPPVSVGRAGGASPFLDEALGVLEAEGRTTSVDLSGAAPDVVVSVGGSGLEDGARRILLVVPPTDPALLPALNRRLAGAGVHWRVEAPVPGGEATVREARLPVELVGTAVARHYRLVTTGDASPGDTDVTARLSTGEPFLVTGRGRSGPYALLSVPFDPAWSDLPVSAAMVPLLQWAVTRQGAAGAGRRAVTAGRPIPTPPSATAVRDPAGATHRVGGSRTFRETRTTGIHEVLAGDSVVESVAVNAPVEESVLTPLGAADLETAVGPGSVLTDEPGAWSRAIFRSRRGSEPWRPLLLTALLLLLLESWMAASGRRPATPAGGRGRTDADGTPRESRGASSDETTTGSPAPTT